MEIPSEIGNIQQMPSAYTLKSKKFNFLCHSWMKEKIGQIVAIVRSECGTYKYDDIKTLKQIGLEIFMINCCEFYNRGSNVLFKKYIHAVAECTTLEQFYEVLNRYGATPAVERLKNENQHELFK